MKVRTPGGERWKYLNRKRRSARVTCTKVTEYEVNVNSYTGGVIAIKVGG